MKYSKKIHPNTYKFFQVKTRSVQLTSVAHKLYGVEQHSCTTQARAIRRLRLAETRNGRLQLECNQFFLGGFCHNDRRPNHSLPSELSVLLAPPREMHTALNTILILNEELILLKFLRDATYRTDKCYSHICPIVNNRKFTDKLANRQSNRFKRFQIDIDSISFHISLTYSEKVQVSGSNLLKSYLNEATLAFVAFKFAPYNSLK
jgi:hypothetical protein